jgi:hypothetical protein
MESDSTTADAEALALVHQGWSHLRLQRPLAAWASWQQAIRVRPDDRAAIEALDRLATSPVLPESARRVYRLRSPDGPSRRSRWDDALRAGDLGDLANAERVFARLVMGDPEDAAAWYNLGLCRAWRGENALAIRAIRRFVASTAADDLETAASAWSLAELLRHGAGAESLADDLSASVNVAWDDDGAEPRTLLDAWPHRAIPAPQDPLRPATAALRVYELLDRGEHDPPRVEVTLIVEPGWLRFSTLWPTRDRPWSDLLEENRAALGLVGREIGAMALHVLPLHLLDSQAWAFRLPDRLDPTARAERTVEALDRYYRTDWAETPRHGLAPGEPDPDSAEPPRKLIDRISVGDRVAAAQLDGVIRLREELASRPQFAPMYAGFSFDPLRAEFGLPLRWEDGAADTAGAPAP